MGEQIKAAREEFPRQPVGSRAAYVQHEEMCDLIDRLRDGQQMADACHWQAIERWGGTCHNVLEAIAAGRSLADVVSIVETWLDGSDAIDAPEAELIGRARDVALRANQVTPEAAEALTLLEAIATVMQTEEGEPVHVMSEPERGDHVYVTPQGVEFTLRPAFDEELWERIVTLAFDLPREAAGGVL